MKTKYWEAQIPKTTVDWFFYFDSTFQCPKTGLKIEQDPNSKNVIVFITEDEKEEAIIWLKESKILLCSWQEGWTEDEIIIQYVFRFKTVEDAMAFKLTFT